MKKLLLIASLVATSLPLSSQVVVDWGLGELDLNSNAVYNYGGGNRVETDTMVSFDLSNYAQVNWNTDETVADSSDLFNLAGTGIDLSDFASGAKELVLTGSIINPDNLVIRMHLYSSTLSGVDSLPGATLQEVPAFSGLHVFTSGGGTWPEWNSFATDGFGNGGAQTSGGFDWSNVTGIGFRAVGTGTVSFELDNISLVSTTTPVPEPSTYALLVGIVSLGLIIYRRRKRA